MRVESINNMTTISISDEAAELVLQILYEISAQYSDPDNPKEDNSYNISLLQNVIDELEINRG